MILGFPEAVGGANSTENAGFLPIRFDRKTLVDRCEVVIEDEYLPIEDCYLELSTSTILMSLGRKGLIGNEIKTCRSSGVKLFDSKSNKSIRGERLVSS